MINTFVLAQETFTPHSSVTLLYDLLKVTGPHSSCLSFNPPGTILHRKVFPSPRHSACPARPCHRGFCIRLWSYVQVSICVSLCSKALWHPGVGPTFFTSMGLERVSLSRQWIMLSRYFIWDARICCSFCLFLAFAFPSQVWKQGSSRSWIPLRILIAATLNYLPVG